MTKTATQFLYNAAGAPALPNLESIEGHCWLCGEKLTAGVKRESVIRGTFMDIDKARNPSGSHLCAACVWCFSEQDEVLTKRVGSFWTSASLALSANQPRLDAWQKKNKTQAIPSSLEEIGISEMWGGYAVPQRMRTYSHFVICGDWVPMTKAQKPQMRAIILNPPKTEWLGVIADTGQKHIIFRSKVSTGRTACIVQFEEQSISYEPISLKSLYEKIQALYDMGFSKEEIGSGKYLRMKLAKVSLQDWRLHERAIAEMRDSKIFMLALFLVQKET